MQDGCVKPKTNIMKRSLLTTLVSVVLLSGCLKDSVRETKTFYRPSYRTTEEVKSSIKSAAPAALVQPGKIVAKDHFLFVNEIDKGIHVIDIANPSNPVNLAFIAIPGNIDLMVNGNYLYADCYTDMVTMDISNPSAIVVKQFLNGVFPRRYYSGFSADTTKVIQDWIRVDTIVDRRFSESFRDLVPDNSIVYLSNAQFFSSVSKYSTGGMAIAGSMARFAMMNDRMYAVSNDDLKVFNATSPAAPAFTSIVSLGQGNIETIFPYKNKLFIGSQSGMFIYDASNPDKPQKFGQFVHARACDPVIADDYYAYVTLSGGARCGGFANQMDVIRISDLANPVLIKSYELTGPKGLSKDGNLLFICDKDALKIFNASNASSITQVQKIPASEPSDVIVFNGIAMMVAKDGIYLVDYTTPATASIVGKIQVAQK